MSFWVAGDRDHDREQVISAIREEVLDLFGAQGLSRIEPKLIGFDAAEQRGVLRCDRAHMTDARAALTLVTRVGDSNATIHVEKVSGTIKSLKV